MDNFQFHEAVRIAERVAEKMRTQGATYLYDGLYVYNDGFRYWLVSEQDQQIPLDPRTLKLFLEYLKEHPI